ETHAFCLALASAALLGFFPASVALLTLLKHVLRWDAAYNVLLDTLRIYFPTNRRLSFVISRFLCRRLAGRGCNWSLWYGFSWVRQGFSFPSRRDSIGCGASGRIVLTG